MELPELKYSYYGGPRAAVIIGDGTLILPREIAKEIVRRCNRWPDLLTACEQAFNKSHNPEVEKILQSAIIKAEKGGQ